MASNAGAFLRYCEQEIDRIYRDAAGRLFDSGPEVTRHRDSGADANLFDGDNPFKAEPGASRALSWERAHWREQMAKLEEQHRLELEQARGGVDGMRRELAAALTAGDARPLGPEVPESERVANYSWSRLLALVGFMVGKASMVPQVMQAPTVMWESKP